jgi:hypothetical protein
MPGDFDFASQIEEQFRAAAIENARLGAASNVKPTGICGYCRADVKKGQLYCDQICADDHAYEKKRLQAQGR